MLIGEIAQYSGMSKDTIRWYEKVGLIKSENTRRNSSNYRVYDQETLDTLILIKQSKSFGFSLREIREMLELIEYEKLNCDTVIPIVDAKLKVIEEKIASLRTIQKKLINLKQECSGDCQDQMLKHAE